MSHEPSGLSGGWGMTDLHDEVTPPGAPLPAEPPVAAEPPEPPGPAANGHAHDRLAPAVEALPGLARVAASAAWHTTGWGVRTSLRSTARLARAVTDPTRRPPWPTRRPRRCRWSATWPARSRRASPSPPPWCAPARRLGSFTEVPERPDARPSRRRGARRGTTRAGPPCASAAPSCWSARATCGASATGTRRTSGCSASSRPTRPGCCCSCSSTARSPASTCAPAARSAWSAASSSRPA